jgi:hypothetical protein
MGRLPSDPLDRIGTHRARAFPVDSKGRSKINTVAFPVYLIEFRDCVDFLMHFFSAFYLSFRNRLP